MLIMLMNQNVTNSDVTMSLSFNSYNIRSSKASNAILNSALQKGDIIKVLKKYDNGKWFGQKGDRTGYFQFNYVQVIPASESPD